MQCNEGRPPTMWSATTVALDYGPSSYGSELRLIVATAHMKEEQ